MFLKYKKPVVEHTHDASTCHFISVIDCNTAFHQNTNTNDHVISSIFLRTINNTLLLCLAWSPPQQAASTNICGMNA